ncbi:MAG: hypothetical protein KOO66_10415 [Bacteroidales bacterium]|nr:hypothetical protein [Bacteroidales bacterium]
MISILIVTSCSNPYKNLTTTEYSINEIHQIPYALPFSEKALIYKANINFFNNDISGLLILKKTDESNYRIALTTQFGLKIFDFELNHGILNVKYCVEYLNKKVIINTFQNDFNLLLMQNHINNIFVIENPEQDQKIWQLKSGKLTYNYIQETESEKIANISFKKRNSDKISVGLYNYKGNIPENITLEHHNIKLKMNLKLIQ